MLDGSICDGEKKEQEKRDQITVKVTEGTQLQS